MSHRQVSAFRFLILFLFKVQVFQGSPLSSIGQPTDTNTYLRKLIYMKFDYFAKSFQSLPEASRIAELQTLLVLSEYMIYGGHEKANCDKLVQWMDKIFGQVASLCQSIEGDISNHLQAKFQSADFQALLQRKGDLTEWKDVIRRAALLPADSLLVKELRSAETATFLENGRRLASILEGEREGDGHFLYYTTVIDLYLTYIPKGTLSELLEDSLPKENPNSNGQPTVLNLGKMMDDQIEELAQGIRSFPDESERLFTLQTLLALSEYMIYGGHETEHCDKLVQWMDKIFPQDASLCQLIEGQISKDLYGKFQSQDFQVLFKQKFDFTQLKGNLTAGSLVWKEIANAEKATVLENARRLASIIDTSGDTNYTKGDGYSLYYVSVLYTYWAILGSIDKDTRNDNSKDTLPDNSMDSLPDNSTGKPKGSLPAWALKHPKYSIAGGLTLGGIALALLNYFKPSANQETTSGKNETLIPVTFHDGKVTVTHLLAGTCFLVGAGVLLYFCTSYCTTAPGNVQQAEGKEPKRMAKKQSASTVTMTTSSLATGQTST